MAKTDERIRDDVIAELQWEPELGNPDAIGVAVDDGIVTLSGNVGSYLEKMAAERAARRVLGVEAVVEHIEVKLPFEPDDTSIARAVRNGLDLDASIPANDIEIKIENGWLTLQGNVDWAYQRSEAQKLAGRISGVRGITNDISIKSRNTPTNLRQLIEDAIGRIAVMEGNHIDVKVEDGRVLLTGTVRRWVEKEEARRAAYSAPGVTLVDDQIRIIP